MDKQLLISVATEIAGALLRSALEFGRTLGVSDAELDAAFKQAREVFKQQDPNNIHLGR